MLIKEYMIKDFRKYIFISFSLLFFLLQGCASSVSVISDETFNEISTYKIGDNRTKLTELSNKIDSLAKTEETRKLAEADLLEFLESDATFDSKQFICRELRIIGSENSVSVLSDLLMDEETTSIAKYALENIPGNKVDEELIDLLSDASNKVKIAIINTLGSRSSQQAVPQLSKLLNHSNPEVAIASASALGKIGNMEALKSLNQYINTKNQRLNMAVLDSYLLGIGNMENKSEAHNFYLNLYANELPTNIKQATLVGIINTSKNKEKEILDRINSESEEVKFIPISLIRELPNNTDIKKYAKLLQTLQPANQIQMLAVLKERGNKSVKPFVLPMLKSKVTEVRIAALNSLITIGDENDVLKLAIIATTKAGLESKTASATLDLLKGDKIDNAIVANISSTENKKIKAELIRTVGARNNKTAFNDIIKFAKCDDNKVKSETFKSLANIASVDNLPALIDLLLNQEKKSDKKRVERTIAKVLIRNQGSNSADYLISTFESNSDIENKLAILRLLGFTGDEKSLEILRSEMKNSSEQIKIAAINGLSNWPTAKPLNDLKNATIIAKDNKVKSAALKGFTKFIDMDKSISNDKKVELYLLALKYSETSNERNIALDGIGHTDCFASLDAVKNYVNQEDVKQTVDDAINRVSWHLHEADPERVRSYVEWFLSKVKDEKFQTKNTRLLSVIDKFIKTREENK